MGVDRRVEVVTEISNPPRMAFGEVTVDIEGRGVRTPSGASSLEPKVFDLLLTLAERPGLTASRSHLIETVWGLGEGSDETLRQALSKLRQALGDDDRAPRFIETVPRIGYRWIFAAPPEPMPPSRWSLGSAWSALAVVVGGLGRESRSFVER
jgi:DNA-binding winged helix-turn-helix (wHTH) protein